jgi:hypothetical protein
MTEYTSKTLARDTRVPTGYTRPHLPYMRPTHECTAYSQVNSVSWVVLLGQRKSTSRRCSRRRRREVTDVKLIHYSARNAPESAPPVVVQQCPLHWRISMNAIGRASFLESRVGLANKSHTAAVDIKRNRDQKTKRKQKHLLL